jgi:hypothetical protein
MEVIYDIQREDLDRKNFSLTLKRGGEIDVGGEWNPGKDLSFDAWYEYILYTGEITKGRKGYNLSIRDAFTNDLLLINKSVKNIEDAKREITLWIKEKSKAFRPFILSDAYQINDNMTYIFKEVDGKMTWVATDFGFGKTFYPRDKIYGNHYSAKKGYFVKNRIDKLFFSKCTIHGSGYSISGLKDEEKEREITKALYV